jgi:hypothetical protein
MTAVASDAEKDATAAARLAGDADPGPPAPASDATSETAGVSDGAGGKREYKHSDSEASETGASSASTSGTEADPNAQRLRLETITDDEARVRPPRACHPPPFQTIH